MNALPAETWTSLLERDAREPMIYQDAKGKLLEAVRERFTPHPGTDFQMRLLDCAKPEHVVIDLDVPRLDGPQAALHVGLGARNFNKHGPIFLPVPPLIGTDIFFQHLRHEERGIIAGVLCNRHLQWRKEVCLFEANGNAAARAKVAGELKRWTRKLYGQYQWLLAGRGDGKANGWGDSTCNP